MNILPITKSTSLDTVVDFLTTAGKGSYFTDVSETSGTIKCMKDSITALEFQLAPDQYGNDVYINNIYSAGNALPENFSTLVKIIQTNYGICFVCSDSGSQEVPYIIVTLDDQDDTIIWVRPADPYSQRDFLKTKYYCFSVSSPVFVEKAAPYSTETQLMTTTVPIVVEGVARYTPNLKWVVQRQYIITGAIALGNQQYYSDGFIAIRDV